MSNATSIWNSAILALKIAERKIGRAEHELNE